MEHFTDDVEYRVLAGVPDGDLGPLHGQDAVRAWLQDWIDMFDGFWQKLVELIDAAARAARPSNVWNASTPTACRTGQKGRRFKSSRSNLRKSTSLYAGCRAPHPASARDAHRWQRGWLTPESDGNDQRCATGNQSDGIDHDQRKASDAQPIHEPDCVAADVARQEAE
jgi:hypothetical protein